MTTELYRAPAARVVDAARASGSGGTGELSIATALADGWAATWRNLGPWAGGVLGSMGALAGVGMGLAASGVLDLSGRPQPQVVLALIGVASLLGLLFTPALVWGSLRFVLNAIDGRAQLRDLFSGIPAFAACCVPVLAVGFAMAAALLPGALLSNAVMYAGYPWLGFGLSWLNQTLVMPRLYLAPFFLVDGELTIGPGEAIACSWRATRGQWLRLVGLTLVSVGVMLAGMLALGVGMIPASLLQGLLWASAYRQLAGRGSVPA